MATSITLTTNSASTEYTLATGGRGPAGATGPAGAAGTELTAGTGIDITAGVVSSTVTGNATHTGDATGSTALTLATVNNNVGSFTNASLTVNAKGLVTAASHGTSAITSITGTTNQITVSGALASKTLSLPATINGLTSVTSTTFVGALTGNATTSTSTTGNAATVTTNANLTGPVTSTGNATAIANGAISNAMLANSAVTNLSGTNTGDETAARIATALNAGTEDSTAADTDKLAVTHPAGGWMLLGTLWSWITGKINTLAKLDAIVADATLARTDAGQTFSGTQTFSGQIASSGSTDATVSTNVVNVATNDARYSGPKFSAYNNANQLVPTGTYTKIVYQAEDFDTASCYNTATSRFTPNKAGYYLISVGIRSQTNANSSIFYVYKNGSAVKAILQDSNHSTINRSASLFSYANGTTDYFEIYCWHNKGSDLTVEHTLQTNGFFSGTFIP